MKYDMIMFDIDGTIWDVSYMNKRYCNEVLLEHGYSDFVTDEKIQESLGMNERNFADNVYDFIDDPDIRITFLREEEVLKNDALIKEQVEPYPYFIDTVKSLSQKYKIGIVSNCGANTIELLIDKLKIGDYITDFAACSKLKITKAEGIKKIADDNDAKCFCYVGDTALDKTSSEKAGASFIHAKYGFGKDLESKYSINDLSELESLISKMEEENN